MAASSLVLVCDAKSWFTTTQQIAMGTGNAGPAYTKAREIQSYAYAARWQNPAPAAGSDVATAMDKDLQAISKIVTTLAGSPSVSDIVSAITEMQTICNSIVKNDATYAQTGKRSSVVAQIAKAEAEETVKCGFWHPFACVEEAGGVLLKWVAIGAVVYLGGKWVLARTSSGQKLLGATKVYRARRRARS